MSASLRTETCAAHGHPEFTIINSDPLVPGMDLWLRNYLEAAVETGTRFQPGQTIGIGWSIVRVIERADDTLGIEERTTRDTWVEQVDRTLQDLWYQQEIAASVGQLDRLDFPQADQLAGISPCGLTAPIFVLSRDEPGDDEDSGWAVLCGEDHEHEEGFWTTLFQLSVSRPFITQFLALPVGATVMIPWHRSTASGRIRPRVMIDGELIHPESGSYLAALQADD